MQKGMKVLVFNAEWGKYGKKAGPVRNQKMLDEGMPNVVYAFHSNIEASRGTRDMLERVQKAGLKYTVIS